MHPTHHVHISTGFMFVCLLFIVVIVALFVWLSWSDRRAKLIKMQIDQRHAEQMERIRRGHDDQIARAVAADTRQKAETNDANPKPAFASCIASDGSRLGDRTYGDPSDPFGRRARRDRAPVCNDSTPAAPVIVNTGSGRSGGSDFVEGALLGGIAGSMMGGRDHDTVIERDVSAPAAAPAPDPFAGSGNDAGSSGGGFDYSSGGGDSGGGFDCGGSSGGFDSGGCDF